MNAKKGHEHERKTRKKTLLIFQAWLTGPRAFMAHTHIFSVASVFRSACKRARARVHAQTHPKETWDMTLAEFEVYRMVARFLFSRQQFWFGFYLFFLHTHISICCCNVNCFIDLFDLMRDFIITTHAPAILYSMYIVTILSNTERSNICRIVTGPTRQKFAGCVMLSDRRFLIDGFGCAAVNEVSNITE